MSPLLSLLDEAIAQLTDPEQGIWVAIRTDGAAGSGTRDDPFDGSTPDSFDAVMRSAPENARILFGPGVFSTRGGSAGDFQRPPISAGNPSPANPIVVAECSRPRSCFAHGIKRCL